MIQVEIILIIDLTLNDQIDDNEADQDQMIEENNNIRMIPDCIVELKAVKELYLYGNPLETRILTG